MCSINNLVEQSDDTLPLPNKSEMRYPPKVQSVSQSVAIVVIEAESQSVVSGLSGWQSGEEGRRGGHLPPTCSLTHTSPANWANIQSNAVMECSDIETMV